jgi:hypothetical protein
MNFVNDKDSDRIPGNYGNGAQQEEVAFIPVPHRWHQDLAERMSDAQIKSTAIADTSKVSSKVLQLILTWN